MLSAQARVSLKNLDKPWTKQRVHIAMVAIKAMENRSYNGDDEPNFFKR